MRERRNKWGREGGRTVIVTPPVCDSRISGAVGFVFSPLCGLQPPGYGEASGYLYTLPVQHKAAQCCSADHKIISTLPARSMTPDASCHAWRPSQYATDRISSNQSCAVLMLHASVTLQNLHCSSYAKSVSNHQAEFCPVSAFLLTFFFSQIFVTKSKKMEKKNSMWWHFLKCETTDSKKFRSFSGGWLHYRSLASFFLHLSRWEGFCHFR